MEQAFPSVCHPVCLGVRQFDSLPPLDLGSLTHYHLFLPRQIPIGMEESLKGLVDLLHLPPRSDPLPPFASFCLTRSPLARRTR